MVAVHLQRRRRPPSTATPTPAVISRLRKLISRQFSRPAGPAGRIVAALMNRGNRKINTRAHDLLDPKEGSHVLDLGFGGGLGLDMLLERGARVTGIDRAPDMVAAAVAHHPEAIASGRLTLVEGDVTALPLPADSVDGVVTINTVYFWPDLAHPLGELGRVLSPGGTLVIGIRDGSVMNNVDREIFTIRSHDEIKTSVADAGFEDVRIESPSDQKVHFIVARAPRGSPVAG